MKSGSLVAFAAALAALALPASASAQDGRWGGNRGGDAAAAQNDRGSWRGGQQRGGEQRGGWRGGEHRSAPRARSERPATAVPQAQAQSQAQPQAPARRNWSRGDAVNRGTGGSPWRAPDNARRQAQPSAQAERRDWSGTRERLRGNDNVARWRGDSANRTDQRWDDRRDNRWQRDNDSRWRGDSQWRGNDRDRWRDGRQAHARNWNRDWRRDHRYDWRSYRNANRGIYRLNPYYAPYRSYSYRRLSPGFRLEAIFFGSRYWIDDPWQYRLPPVDGPYRWIRYYDDALLVDIYSGEVVDAIYNFFW